MTKAIRAERCDHCEHIEQKGETIRYWGRCTLPYGHKGPHVPEMVDRCCQATVIPCVALAVEGSDYCIVHRHSPQYQSGPPISPPKPKRWPPCPWDDPNDTGRLKDLRQL